MGLNGFHWVSLNCDWVSMGFNGLCWVWMCLNGF